MLSAKQEPMSSMPSWWSSRRILFDMSIGVERSICVSWGDEKKYVGDPKVIPAIILSFLRQRVIEALLVPTETLVS